MQQKAQLPIDSLLPEIADCLERNMLTLLEAEPGAGKTTRLPPYLLTVGKKPIYVLEPRRLAARMAAHRVAAELAEDIGDTVGYQVRFEEVSSSRTRLWYLTEGVLSRKLLARFEFPPGSIFILDEFHERHLETDLAFALLRDLQAKRPDIRLLIMSATLNAEDLAAKLGKPPLIRAPGKAFPVDLRYSPQSTQSLEERVAAAVSAALPQTKGHLLVFLPGASEIRRAMQSCESIARQTGARLLPLHGDLSPQEQDLAVAPSSFRKIICSTNVAESSLTIEGVGAVVDSGLARVATHSAWSGLSRLQVEKISQAAAVQRAGRAGRTGPGLAIRLYPESDFVRRPAQSAAEILRTDLAQLLLQLAAYGAQVEQLFWLDPPPAGTLRRARDLLLRLHAMNADGDLTKTGRMMAKLSVHPRLARFILAASEMGAKREACDLAGLLTEGRIRLEEQNGNTGTSDLEAILAAPAGYQTQRLARQLLNSVPATLPVSKSDPRAIEKALLVGYPDRVAKKRGEMLLLAGGGSSRLHRSSAVRSEFLVAIDVEDRQEAAAPVVRIASAIEPEWLLDFFPERMETGEELTWNREAERVEQLNSLRYDGLAIDESRVPARANDAASSLLAEKALEAGLQRFVDADELTHLMLRVKFAADHATAIDLPPDLPAATLRGMCAGLTSFSDLRSVTKAGGFIAFLKTKLPMRLIDEMAPPYIVLPSGRRAKIEYHEGRAPSVSSRLQDFFGMQESPSVAKGAVPLVVHLLAPNQRPLQVTTDLASFWKNLYPQVRRELSRRYPKHSWP